MTKQDKKGLLVDIYSYEIEQKSKRAKSYYNKNKQRRYDKRITLQKNKPRTKTIKYIREEDIDNT